MQSKLTLLISPAAESDLEDIYKYTLELWSLHQAEKYQDMLYDSMTLICERPSLGKTYKSSSKSYRVFLTGKHVFCYIVADKSLILVRILHTSMLKEYWLD
jgi:toxin ParE1/3/4